MFLIVLSCGSVLWNYVGIMQPNCENTIIPNKVCKVMWRCDIFLVMLEKWIIQKYKKRLNLKIGDTRSLFCFEILCWFTILWFAAANILIIYIFWWHLCYCMHHIWINPGSWIFTDVTNVIHIFCSIFGPLMS